MSRKPPFTPNIDGSFAVNLSENERTLLRELPGEMLRLLDEKDDDRSTFRLFPRAYDDDLGRQVEYDRLMRDDLQERHIEALDVLSASAEAANVSLEQLDTWARALNLIRLVLGTRLDVDASTTEKSFPKGSPIAATFAMYAYLGELQEHAVDALSRSLPPSLGANSDF